MRTPSLLLLVVVCLTGYSQTKPLTITQKQIGQKIVLIASNNTTIEYEYELSITSSGLKVNKDLPLLGHLNAGEVMEVLTLTPVPGQKASFSYKLKPIPIINNEVIAHKEVGRSNKVVIANSAKHHEVKARQHVENQIDSEIVTVFTKDFCEICDELLRVLEDKKIPFQEKNVSNSISNNELMWNALYIYGRVEGKVNLPVMVYQSKVFNNLTDLLLVRDQASGH